MKQFRFIGDPTDYSKPFPRNGTVYDFNFIEKQWETTGGTINQYPEDWQEVFETVLNHQNQFTTDSTKLHKDTDLGYYAGLMMANGYMVEDAILRAKELIKQLNEESNG